MCSTCVQDGRVGSGLSDWDRRQELGLFQAAAATMGAITLHPINFFTKLAPEGRLGSAALFLLLVSIPAGFMTTAVSAGFQTAFPTDISMYEDFLDADSVWMQLVTWSAEPSFLKAGLNLVFFPFWVVIVATIASLFVHLGLIVVGGNQNGYLATLKAVYYGRAITFWAVVPVFGIMLAGFWAYATVAIGASKLHGVPGWKGAAAVLWLPILLIALLCGAMILGIAFIWYEVSSVTGGP